MGVGGGEEEEGYGVHLGVNTFSIICQARYPTSLGFPYEPPPLFSETQHCKHKSISLQSDIREQKERVLQHNRIRQR